jgi:acetyl esterase/lipase
MRSTSSVRPASAVVTTRADGHFIVLELPLHFYRIFKAKRGFPADGVDKFSTSAPLFEVLVVRCMRYALASVPPAIIKCCFHKSVALPFAEYRDWDRREDKNWEEVESGDTRGIWIQKEKQKPPSFVLYYIHGGGYQYGSVWFYLPWLQALHAELCAQVGNAAIFALSYGPAPEFKFPSQIHEAWDGYTYVVDRLGLGKDGRWRVCIGGDSAGGAIAMMVIEKLLVENKLNPGGATPLPRQVLLISPWLVPERRGAESTAKDDFVTNRGLEACAWAYMPGGSGSLAALRNASVVDRIKEWPKRSNLDMVFHVWVGGGETLRDEIIAGTTLLEEGKWDVRLMLENAHDRGLHVWPVAAFFLARTQARRLEGIKELSDAIGLVFRSNRNLLKDEDSTGKATV